MIRDTLFAGACLIGSLGIFGAALAIASTINSRRS